MAHADWGSVPEWLQGVGAIIALLFAAWAVYTGRETNAHQARQISALERSEELRHRSHREQYAVRLACWVSAEKLDDEILGDLAVAIRLVNSSELPMYRLTVYVGCSTGVVISRYNHVGPVSKRRLMTRPTKGIRELIGFRSGRQVLDANEVWIALTFRDPANRWWLRAPAGALEEATSEREASERCQASIAHYYETAGSGN